MRRIPTVGPGRSHSTYTTMFPGKCVVFPGEVSWAYEHEQARVHQ